MNNEQNIEKSPGFVSIELMEEKLESLKKDSSINQIHYAHNTEKGDVVNHMPFNSGLYYQSLAKEATLPLTFKDDIESCQNFKQA